MPPVWQTVGWGSGKVTGHEGWEEGAADSHAESCLQQWFPNIVHPEFIPLGFQSEFYRPHFILRPSVFLLSCPLGNVALLLCSPEQVSVIFFYSAFFFLDLPLLTSPGAAKFSLFSSVMSPSVLGSFLSNVAAYL